MCEKTKSSRLVYQGRILDLEVQEVELPDGRLALREIVRHGGAVAVLAQRPDGKFLFVRQFRKPIEQTILEVVAGNREPAESPELCARRELAEETGYRAEWTRWLGHIYPSPGYVDEKIDVFYARTEAHPGPRALDEDEHLQVVALEEADVLALIRDREIFDSKTLAAWAMYWAQRNEWE